MRRNQEIDFPLLESVGVLFIVHNDKLKKLNLPFFAAVHKIWNFGNQGVVFEAVKSLQNRAKLRMAVGLDKKAPST